MGFSQPAPATSEKSRDIPADLFAVALATLITLCVSGYQFGRGNHTVYLLEGLRLTDSALFTNDWFVRSTLQYHAVFNRLTAWLMQMGIVEQAFLIGYLLIAIGWQAALMLIARALGASRLTYLVSVLLYYVSAAGISLGVYQFLQDACFLPSNVSNVAMLWGIYFWITNRRGWSGLMFGIAGLFHLNHAIVGVGLWGALCLWDWWSDRLRLRPAFAVGTILLFVPSAFNIIHALEVKWRESGSITMDQFVAIYIRFRHSHHFDPLAWPIVLWVAFLWPIPFAIIAWMLRNRQATTSVDQGVMRQTRRIFLIMMSLQAIAFVFAGVWFVSESLVQLILWRFSIYLKLLSCLGAAYLLCESTWSGKLSRGAALWGVPVVLAIVVGGAIGFGALPVSSKEMTIALDVVREHRAALMLFALLAFAPGLMSLSARALGQVASVSGIVACIIFGAVGWNRWFGFGMTPERVDDAYVRMCHWARDNTPVDAVFIVPPSDTAFRLEARRAIAVNFKHVPQLSGEIEQWHERLKLLLGVDNMHQFPREYVKLLAALDAQYESRAPDALVKTAEMFAARYVVVNRDLGDNYRTMRVYPGSNDTQYFVYDREAWHRK